MLRAQLIDTIKAEGPMPFERFMAACLFDPVGGYFVAGTIRSNKAGDFLTSPEVSPWFGRILGRFVAQRRTSIGRSGLVVEVGAGSGSLLRPLKDEVGDGFEYRAVEVSPAARAALAEVIPADQVHPSIDRLPERFSGVIIANELLDNLPVALAVRIEAGWEERWVAISAEGALELVAVPARLDVIEWCDRYAGNVVVGGLVEVEIAACDWIESIIARLDRGALVAVDYGGTAEELEPRRTQGTLRTYRAHHLGPDPLLEPGATDVTVDVNFTAMASAAERTGAEVELMRQDDFLTELGLRSVVGDLRRAELEKARSGDEMGRLHLRSERIDVETLLHPRGLGDFRVLVASVDRLQGHSTES